MTRINAEHLIGRNYCKPDMTIAQRLEHVGYTVTPSGCWEWNGGRHSFGYGVLSIHGKSHYAHRESLQLRLGRELAPGMFACHTCDNPPCMNPDHLFEGTLLENQRDKHAKGRGSGGRIGNRAVKFAEENFNIVAGMRAGGAHVKEIQAATGMSVSYIYSLLNGNSSRPIIYRKEEQ